MPKSEIQWRSSGEKCRHTYPHPSLSCIKLPIILPRGKVPLAMISSLDVLEAFPNSASPNIKSSGRNSLDDRKPCQ